MFPCIESHGIIVANLVDKFAMDYFLGEQYIVWFSLIFFKNAKTDDAPEQTEAETGASPEDDTETVSETLPEPEKDVDHTPSSDHAQPDNEEEAPAPETLSSDRPLEEDV